MKLKILLDSYRWKDILIFENKVISIVENKVILIVEIGGILSVKHRLLIVGYYFKLLKIYGCFSPQNKGNLGSCDCRIYWLIIYTVVALNF